MIPRIAWAAVVISTAVAAGDKYIDYDNLPNATLFPGPWDRYIRAPANKSHIAPARIWKVKGNVTASGLDVREGHVPGNGILLGPGGVLTVEFEENIGGRACFDIESVGENPVVQLAYSESPWFAGPVPDATTDRQERDLPLPLALGNRTGHVCVAPEFVRGAFKYLTISLPWTPSTPADDIGEDTAQRLLVGAEESGNRAVRSRAWVSIASLWVNCTAFPSQADGRAYSGYFYSSSELLNRIWYAGAWTLQLSTIDPREGSALIDYNRVVDGNHSPTGSWYCNFTIARGRAVTTDGAKRDRMVWPGDMYIAVSAIAVSTHDMAAVRSALDVLFAHQYEDGSLPYASPPMGYQGEFSDTYHLHTLLGVYNYVLFSGDVAWLRSHWPDYLRALRVSTSKVDALGLLHVSSTADWLRPGMTGHNLEASTMLHAVLGRSAELLAWLGGDDDKMLHNAAESASVSAEASVAEGELLRQWHTLQRTLEDGLARLYCPDTGLFADNVGRRHCGGPERVDPQDGNSWALISRLDLGPAGRPWTDPKSPERTNSTLPGGPPTALNMSAALRARWIAHGAPAVEFPNVISPFASSFELLAHGAAGDVDAAVELALLEWGYLLDGPGFTNSTLAEGFRVDGHVQYPAYPSAARNSHAHGWAAGPTAALVQQVLGIELLRPAGEEWAVRPVLTKWLGWARGGFATSLGRFEVKVWRALEVGVDVGVQAEDIGNEGADLMRMKKGRRAVLAEVTTPAGTRGTFNFGRAGAAGSDDALLSHSVVEGGTTLWVQWEDSGAVEELDLQDFALLATHDSADPDAAEDWYRRRAVVTVRGAAVRGGKMELRYDEDFRPREMEQRPVGVVDWEVMPRFFRTAVPGRAALPGWAGEDVGFGEL